MKRTLALPSLAAALMIALAAAVAVSLTAGVPKASAYYLANGCDIYNEYNGKIYRCTPDRTTYYTPDGLNPNWVAPGTEGKAYGDGLGSASLSTTTSESLLLRPSSITGTTAATPTGFPPHSKGTGRLPATTTTSATARRKGASTATLASGETWCSPVEACGHRTSSRSGASRRPTSGTTLSGSSAPVTTNRVRRATSLRGS